MEKIREEQKIKEIELAPHISRETKDLIYKLVRINPNERPDIGGVLSHPALSQYHQMPCLTPSEYQIMLRNYMLNTQGTNNRNLPEELEKFINVYNQKPQSHSEELFGPNRYELNATNIVSNGQNHSPSSNPQPNQTTKVHSNNMDNVLKKPYFDSISKVIELENKSSKPQLFKKVHDQPQETNNIDGFKFNGNQKIEKHTNFFESVSNQTSHTKQDTPVLAQPESDNGRSNIKSDSGIIALKNLSPSTVNGNSHTENGNGKEVNKAPKKVNSIQEFNFAKPNLMDEYYFKSNEQNTVDSYGSNRSTAGPVFYRNYSSDSNDLFSRPMFSKPKSNNGVQNSDRLITGPNSLPRPETDSQSSIGRTNNLPLSKFANSFMNRPQVSSFNKPDREINVSQDANGLLSEYRSTANADIQTVKPFDDKSTNILNSAIEIGSSKRKQESGLLNFANAPLELRPTIAREPLDSEKHKVNGAKFEDIKQNLVHISQSEISAKAMAKINTSQPVNLYHPISLSIGKLQKIGSIETSTQSREQPNNDGYYTPMQIKNFLQNNTQETSKVEISDLKPQDKGPQLKIGLSAVLNKSNSMQVMGAQSKLVRANTPLDFTVGVRDKLHPSKDAINNQSNEKFISFMTSNQNNHRTKNVMADGYRNTTNSFVNYNDEDNKRYLQTLSFVGSTRQINPPVLKTEGEEIQWNDTLRGTLTSKRQTAPEYNSLANVSYNRSIPNFGSKLQSRPINSTMNKTLFSRQ